MSGDLGSATLKLGVDAQGLSAGLKTAGMRTSQSLRSMGTKMRGIGTKISLGITAPLLLAGKVAGEEMQAIDEANATTDRNLRRVGAGAKVTREEIVKLASALQAKTGIDDQAVQAGSNVISSLGGLSLATKGGARNLKAATIAATNMAEGLQASGMTVGTASKTIAKSLADPEKAAGRLAKQGIKLTDAQQKLIDKFTKAGNVTAAQGVIIDAVGKKFKGAANLTASDKWNVAKDQLAGIGAEILRNLLPYLQQMIGWIQKGVKWFNGLSAGTKAWASKLLLIAAVAGPVIGILGGLVGALGTIIGALAAIGAPVLIAIAVIAGIGIALVRLYQKNAWFRAQMQAAWKAIAANLKKIFGDLKKTIAVWTTWARAIWKSHGTEISSTLKAVWNVIKTIVGYGLKTVRNIIVAVLAVLRGDWKGAWNAIKAQLANAWNLIKTLIRANIGIMKAILHAAWGAIKSVAKSAWNGIKHAIVSAFTSAVNKVKSVLGSIGSAIASTASSLAGKAADLGADIINGILDGLKSNADKVYSWLTGMAGKALRNVKEKLGIASPSKVFAHQVGKPIAEGIATGIRNSAMNAADELQKLVDRLYKVWKKSKKAADKAALQSAQTLANNAAKYARQIESSFNRLSNTSSLADAYYQLQVALNGGEATLAMQKDRLAELRKEYEALADFLKKNANALNPDEKGNILSSMTSLVNEANSIADAINEANAAAAEAGTDAAVTDTNTAAASGRSSVLAKQRSSAYSAQQRSAGKVVVNQNFRSDPDQFVASRRAAYAFRSAGIVGV